MALVKCPDCGKMVSSRAAACPFCGCPAEFFINEEVSVENASNSLTSNVSDDINVPSESNDSVDVEDMFDTVIQGNPDASNVVHMAENEITFNFGQYEIKYPAGTEGFAEMYGTYVHASDRAYDDLKSKYKAAGNIDKVLETFPDAANTTIFQVINESTKALYNRGVYITSEQFLTKYGNKYPMDYTYYCDSTMEKYADILGEKRQLEAYRQSVQESRGRWTGGGFGLGGAIKGSLMASALNMGSDFLHSFGDNSRKEKDNKKIAEKLKNLYDSSETEMSIGIKKCIINVYNAMIEEMSSANILGNSIHISQVEADSLYDNTKKYETNPETVRSNIIRCMGLYPGEKRFYDDLADFFLNTDTDINEFLKFWHLEYLAKDITERKNSRDEFEKYMQEKGIDGFNFSDYSVPNISTLFTWMLDYDGKIPADGIMAANVSTYMNNVSENIALIETIPVEYNLADFWQMVAKFANWYGMKPFKTDFYQPGTKAFQGFMPANRVLETAIAENGMVELYQDASFMHNGKKGFAVTDRHIYDFKDDVTLDAAKVSAIDIAPVKGSDDKCQLIISGDGGEAILAPADMDQKMAAFLKNAFTVMLVRYYGNTLLTSNLVTRESADHGIYSLYGFTDEECGQKFDEYFENISRGETQSKRSDLMRMSAIRREIKNISGSRLFEGKEQNFVFEYDYETTHQEVKAFLSGYENCGEYILYYDGKIMLGDRYLYMNIKGRERIPLENICEALLYDDPQGNHCDYRLVIICKDRDVRYEFSEDYMEDSPDWFYKNSGKILLALNVVLDNYRNASYTTHYDKDNQYLCDNCGSLDIQVKLRGKQCSRCNNPNIRFRLDESCLQHVLLFRYMKNGAPTLSTDESKKLFYDENMLDYWVEHFADRLDSCAANVSVITKCPSCGKELKPGAKFCVFCGAKIEPGATNSQAINYTRPANPGNYPKNQMSLDSLDRTIRDSQPKPDYQSSAENIMSQSEISLEEYIVANYTYATRSQAVRYYREQTGADIMEATNKVKSLIG